MNWRLGWLAAAVMLCIGNAHAHPYPSKPIRLVVTYPPGGNADLIGRAGAGKLAELARQQVVVESARWATLIKTAGIKIE